MENETNVSEETHTPAHINQPEIYDSNAIQKIEIGDGVFAVMKPYTDKRYLSYLAEITEKLNETLKSKGVDTEAEVEEHEIKESLLQDIALADELLEALEGYEDLPEDWKSLISAEDKIALLRKATRFTIDEDSRKFTLGAFTEVPTVCYFNDKLASQTHKLRRTTIDNSSRYALIQAKRYKVGESSRVGRKNVVQITPQEENKAALYDQMIESVTGFERSDVPIRVKSMVVDYVFQSSLDEKK